MTRLDDPGTTYPSISAVVCTDQGLIRTENEDSAYTGRHLIAVADGMGGLPAGELASEVTIRAVAGVEADGELASEARLRVALMAADREIRAAVEADPSREGMGTTLTALLLSGPRLALVHIGDSRAYRLRAGSTVRLSRDDTWVQELVDRGALDPADVRRHPQRSHLTKALQGRGERPEWTWLTTRPGDRYLICSDGLSDVVDDEAIGAALAGRADPTACAQELISLALQAGGPDNITVIVADLVSSADAGSGSGSGD
jgi:serine/threonine protein phosphatase PrpC